MSYFTFNSPEAPGAIGSLGQEGTVQPQDPFALEMINGSVPVLVKINTHSPLACCFITP